VTPDYRAYLERIANRLVQHGDYSSTVPRDEFADAIHECGLSDWLLEMWWAGFMIPNPDPAKHPLEEPPAVHPDFVESPYPVRQVRYARGGMFV